MHNTLNPHDIWHYPRQDTATKLITALDIGAVTSMVIFAPRRIGKTEFLIRDLKPIAIKHNYHVVYFNFHADKHNQDSVESFLEELRHEVNNGILSKIDIKEVNLPWCRINLKTQKVNELDINQLLSLLVIKLQRKNQKLLLLLDEIQELSFKPKYSWFIGSLRTALDVNKQNISVVFTGSSRGGLMNMFQNSKAPFFHFSANFEFEYFNKDFTDFLADNYKKILGKPIDKKQLYEVFCRLGRITLYIREIINIKILNPDWSLNDVYEYYIAQISEPDKYQELWHNFSDAEKSILVATSQKFGQIYSSEFVKLAEQHGFTVTRGQLQYAIKKLTNNSFVTINPSNEYEIIDPYLKNWIIDNIVIKG